MYGDCLLCVRHMPSTKIRWMIQSLPSKGSQFSERDRHTNKLTTSTCYVLQEAGGKCYRYPSKIAKDFIIIIITTTITTHVLHLGVKIISNIIRLECNFIAFPILTIGRSAYMLKYTRVCAILYGTKCSLHAPLDQ